VEGTTLRRALNHDALQVAKVYFRARRAALPLIPPYTHTDDEVREWISSIVIALQDTWVAETENRDIVAMMSLENGWIDQLYVDPEWSGQGIGSALVQLAQERYPCGLELWTFESNIGARRFYERHGFREAERTDGRENEEHAPALRYLWSAL
jgi:GNAT superfamily N-acetyltransferase